MAWNLQNGLLGMGGFGGGDMPTSSLLGQYYDPAEMRKYQMKQMLLGLGAGLLAEKGMGKGAALALAAGDRAGTQYRDNALDAYRMKTAADERQYQRGLDKRADERWNKDFALRQKDAAWQDTVRQQQLEDRQRAEDLRAGHQSAVTDFVQNYSNGVQQGSTLPFSPEVRGIARQGGLAGVDAANPVDVWRYGQMQPNLAAGDYESAFPQLSVTPPKPEQYTLGPGQQRRDEYGNILAEGPPKTPDTVINNGGVDDFNKNLAKGVADVYKSQMEQGSNAAATKNAAQQLRVLMKGRGGALDGFSATIAPYMPSGLIPEGANDLVAAQAVIAGMIPKQRIPGSGTTSDYDAKMFAQSLPSLWNKPGANEIILNTIESYADYQTAVSNIIADVAADSSIQNKSSAIREQIAAIPDPFAQWKQATKSGVASSGAAVDPANPQPGDVVLGYRFKGGNRRDPNNWEKVQ